MANILRPVAALWAVTLLAGCHAFQPLPPRAPISPTPSVTGRDHLPTRLKEEMASSPEVVRYDRYLLVSIDPKVEQHDPLSGIIELRIPASTQPTIGDALRYVLRQSGYSLCATGQASRVLYRQRLPGVQYRLGPMRLRTALQLMGAPAWQVEVDDVQRVVCHRLRERYPQPVMSLVRWSVYSREGG